jgi:hypothetical protein
VRPKSLNNLAHLHKYFFSGCLLFSYLIFGSGTRLVVPLPKLDSRQIVFDFASTLPRRVYKYSVVPGGVESPEELAAARRDDPVVAANFADFGTHTEITTLKRDMFVYVAYRMGNKVYYSKKKHKVCKGEEVITDGKNLARTRCANRIITKLFKAPTIKFNEPKPPELDLIEPPELSLEIPPDPLLAQSYYPTDQTPYSPRYDVIPPGQTGANTGAKPAGPYLNLPSEVIFPQFPPFSGIAPGVLFPPTGRTTPPISPPPVVPPPVVPPPVVPPPVVPPIGPPPVLTPEPGGFYVIALSASGLLWARRRKKRLS